MRNLQITSYQIRCRRPRREHGQSLLEFALVLLMLFVMLLGVTIMAQGFNLQMVLYGAAYEGARIWAKNPVGGDTIHCTPPACNALSGTTTNFEAYVAPAVRQYLANHGYKDEVGGKKKLYFFSKDSRTAQNTLNLISNNPQLVTVTVLYSYELPFSVFDAGGAMDIEYKEVLVSASCTLKRGG